MLNRLHLLLRVRYHSVTAKADCLIGTAEAIGNIFAQEAGALVRSLKVVALACSTDLKVSIAAKPLGKPTSVYELSHPN